MHWAEYLKAITKSCLTTFATSANCHPWTNHQTVMASSKLGLLSLLLLKKWVEVVMVNLCPPPIVALAVPLILWIWYWALESWVHWVLRSQEAL